jgi:hypothetical protein
MKRHLLNKSLLLALLLITLAGLAQTTPDAGSKVQIGLLKYKGGGDWYSGARALTNLISFMRTNTNVQFMPEPVAVEPGSVQLFAYPILFINGHGNVFFTPEEVENLRKYFAAGGFLFANDDYGMDPSFRRELKKILPGSAWIDLPFAHPIYHTFFDFPNGCPKIHEHDKLPAQGLGLFYDGVMVCFYDYQSDLCDGWEDESVHGDPLEKRQAATKMGTNVILHALSRGVN